MKREKEKDKGRLFFLKYPGKLDKRRREIGWSKD